MIDFSQIQMCIYNHLRGMTKLKLLNDNELGFSLNSAIYICDSHSVYLRVSLYERIINAISK